ncbi:MAG TPA: porphobilinogen synthase, partial [Fimbriimonadaceae bacterium]|nr:porphobilinogen synthase [Fimbriimonadaceae bacterium]
MPDRLRRLRRTPELRELVRETSVRPKDLIYPIFVREGIRSPEPIDSMPGQFRLPVSAVGNLACEAHELGIGALLIFGLPSKKDERATEAYNPNGVVQNAIRAAKDSCPEMVVMTDVCVCAYTPHGHCGILGGTSGQGLIAPGATNREIEEWGSEVLNDETLPLLAEMAVSHARAGADVVGPSSMMDHQVRALREGLDRNGFGNTAIMAYSAKFASGFYGPFRDAADSAPSHGDRSSYQHDAANARHARLELLEDVEEGADILMVKPGLAYLDIIRMAREIADLPIAAYNVSGEYSMVKAAAERGWLDEQRIVLETMTA